MCSALLHREELMSASRIPLVSTEELHRSWRTQAREIDIAALEKELQKNVEGEVRFDAGSKALYAADASNYRQVPIGVVIPKSREDVLPYDGTQMTVGWMDDKQLDEEIRRGGRSGDIYSRLKNLRSKYSKLVEERYPHIPRRVSGYNLDQLIPGEDGRFNIARALVGSESTLVTILEAKVRLMFSYPKRVLLVLGYPSVYESGDHVPEVLKFGPIALEGLDERLIDNVKKKKMRQVEDLSELPEGKGWLVAEFGAGTKEEAEERAREAMKALQASGHPSMKLYTDEAEQQKIWEVRESGLGATAFVPAEPLSW